MAPQVSGYWTSTPHTLASSVNAEGFCTFTAMPRAAPRAFTTSIVCGWQWSATRNVARPSRAACTSCIASAAAVASSSSEALATGSAVRSATTVWKLSRASSRPCAISAWYGVYAVYQPGFSSTFRWITAGTCVVE
jgi:hypothetical protein